MLYSVNKKNMDVLRERYVSGASRARRHGRKSALDIFTVAVLGFNVELSIGHQSAVSPDSRGRPATANILARLSFTPTAALGRNDANRTRSYLFLYVYRN